MRTAIDEAITQIEISGLVSEQELADPSDEVIARLRRQSGYFASLRSEVLKETEVGGSLPWMLQETESEWSRVPPVSDDLLALEDRGSVLTPKMKTSRRMLIAKKRALELSRLLEARMVLEKSRQAFIDPFRLRTVLRNEDLRLAIAIVCSSIRSAHIGTNMLEITTCGAIKPYDLILGGKLTALLLLSPQVATDYRKRYGEGASIIGSQMKNKRLVRDTTLVYLGTTSLYAHGSSQYERLVLPPKTIAEGQPEIRYLRLGHTSGFGSIQFQPATVRAIDKVLNQKLGYREVNSIFGEGARPKFRKLKLGLDELGFPSELLMRHNQRRIIYGVQLCATAIDYLTGRSQDIPGYLADPSQFAVTSEHIADYWRRRWLASRLNHGASIATLALTDSWVLSDQLANRPAKSEPPDQDSPMELARQETNRCAASTSGNQGDPPAIAFWRSIAHAGVEVCSDELADEQLDCMHVESPLEALIVDRIERGYDVVLTGNAGDGKTHLLRRLQTQLSSHKAVVETDATAAMRRGDLAPILNAWRSARSEHCLYARKRTPSSSSQSKSKLLALPNSPTIAAIFNMPRSRS